MNQVPEAAVIAKHGQSGADARPIMELRGVRKSFGPVEALKNVDISIRAGEIHAIVGENGAGKSTLINIAAGVMAADAGTIVYQGQEVAVPHPQTLREAGVSVTFQHPALAPDLTVLENMQLAAPALAGPNGAAEAERILGMVAAEQHWTPVNERVADISLPQRHIQRKQNHRQAQQPFPQVH